MLWVPAFRAAMVDPRESFALVPPRQLTGRTIQQVVRAGIGGDEVRLHWSNVFGRTPLRLTTTVAGHTTSVTVPPGAQTIGGPLPVRVENGGDIEVTAHVEEADLATYHPSAHRTGHVDGEAHTSLFWLAGVDVARTAKPSTVVVTLGDSITDGDGTTLDAHATYPRVLASQLPDAVVLDAGIGGNRLLADVIGQPLTRRADRDLFAVPGVTHVVLLAGVNDIGMAALFGEQPVEAADLTAGLDDLVARIQTAGITPVLGTLTPFAGTPLPGFDNARNQAVREETNTWIRGYRQCAVVDFAATLADPAEPTRLRTGYDSGDPSAPQRRRRVGAGSGSAHRAADRRLRPDRVTSAPTAAVVSERSDDAGECRPIKAGPTSELLLLVGSAWYGWASSGRFLVVEQDAGGRAAPGESGDVQGGRSS